MDRGTPHQAQSRNVLCLVLARQAELQKWAGICQIARSQQLGNPSLLRRPRGQSGEARQNERTRTRHQSSTCKMGDTVQMYVRSKLCTFAAGRFLEGNAQGGHVHWPVRRPISAWMQTLDASHAPRFATHVRGVLTPYAVLGGRGGCNGWDCPLHPMP